MNTYQTSAYHSVEPEIVFKLSLSAAAISERGRARQENEDTILHHIGQSLSGETFGLFMVSDGMGGHQAGKFASQMAVRIVAVELAPVLSTIDELTSAAVERVLRQAIVKANQQLWHIGQTNTEDNFRMGTTMTLALVVCSRLYLAHVGGSRVYLWRKGNLRQLSQDHSLVAELAQQLPMTPAQKEAHPYRSLITRSLGSRETIEIDYLVQPIQSGDRVLLCSNGLGKALGDEMELKYWLASSLSPDEQCQGLLAAANRRDPSDDISLIISHFHNALDQYEVTSDNVFFPQNHTVFG